MPIGKQGSAWRNFALVLAGGLLVSQLLPATTPLIGALKWT